MSEEKVDFKKELDRLDEITKKISSDVLSIDESLALYEEGNQIIKKLEAALKEAEEKIEKVVDIE